METIFDMIAVKSIQHFSTFLSSQNSCVSSAYCTTLLFSFNCSFNSLIPRLKMKGPKVVPCGTFWWSEIQSDSVLYTTVFCCLLQMKLWIKFDALSKDLRFFSLVLI